MKLSERNKDILRFLGIHAAGFAVNVLLKTVRIEKINIAAAETLTKAGKNFVAAFWHGSMALGWYINRNQNFSALVSKSKDGDVLANLLKGWQFKVVRGSSHIGGKEALGLMLELTRQKFSLAITPDGPTGPIYKMKAGAVVTAKKSNIPLILVGIGIKKKIKLKSWDSFEIPKPFSKAVVIFSDPIYVDANLSYEETSGIITDCENRLNELQKRALELCLE
jgi:lysophospholipid acyltransferase (LPLAT)-like uncharacterized protein